MWLLGRVSVRRKYQILGLCLLSLALFLVLALFSGDPRDTAADLVGTGAVRNQAGVLGAFAAAGLAVAFGAWGAWLIPAGLLAWGWNRLRIGQAAELWIRTALGTALLIIGVIAFEIGTASPLRKLLGSLLAHAGPTRAKAKRAGVEEGEDP